MKSDDGYFFHRKGKIIVFDDIEQAQAMLNGFYQYSAQRLISEGGPQRIFELQYVMSLLQIVEKDFVEIPKCGLIHFKDIQK